MHAKAHAAKLLEEGPGYSMDSASAAADAVSATGGEDQLHSWLVADSGVLAVVESLAVARSDLRSSV